VCTCPVKPPFQEILPPETILRQRVKRLEDDQNWVRDWVQGFDSVVVESPQIAGKSSSITGGCSSDDAARSIDDRGANKKDSAPGLQRSECEQISKS